jgi:hypothetical protein
MHWKSYPYVLPLSIEGKGQKYDANVGFRLSFASIISFCIMIQHKNL